VPYRARRIADVLGAAETFSTDDFRRLQTDMRSLMAEDFLPRLLAVPLSLRGEAIRPGLAAWDGTMAPDRPEPLIFHAWYRALVARLFADELGDDFATLNSRRPLAVARVLDDERDWCDDITTDAPETCDEQIAAALDDGLDWIAEHHGADVAAWRWDEAHVATSRHALFSKLPVLKHLFEITRPHGGGPYTVMQANTRIGDEDAPFAETHAAALRTIFDLSDPDSTLAIVHTGQSGHRLSRHYDDLADPWAAGELLSLPMTMEAVEAGAVHRLVLRPTSNDKEPSDGPRLPSG
jgi:penicillin amidase